MTTAKISAVSEIRDASFGCGRICFFLYLFFFVFLRVLRVVMYNCYMMMTMMMMS